MTNIIWSLVSFQKVRCPKNLSTLIANDSYHPITCEFSNSALSFHIHCNWLIIWWFMNCQNWWSLLCNPLHQPNEREAGLFSLTVLSPWCALLLFLEWDRIDWVFRFFWQNGPLPCLIIKIGWIDQVFRFFWQNQPLPCPIFEMGLNRSSF